MKDGAVQGWLDLVRIGDDVNDEFTVPREGGLHQSADGGVVVDDEYAHVAGAVHAAPLDRLHPGLLGLLLVRSAVRILGAFSGCHGAASFQIVARNS